MPSRKQRRREAKSKRHEYEFVYVDSEGNELDDVPEDAVEPKRRREASRNGTKPAAGAKSRSGQRPLRTPPVPSWNRAIKRGAVLGVVVFVLFSLTAKGNYAGVLPLAVFYTILFVPFTYMIDRFAYRRYLAKTGQQPPPARKS